MPDGAANPPDVEALVSYISGYPFMSSSLWVPHCVVMCCALRQFLGDWRRFSRRHPLGCAMLALIYVFPGAIVSALLLAQPPLAFLMSWRLVAPAAVAWYLVFYAPFDFFYRLINTFHLLAPFGVMQDFLRIQLVRSGVDTIVSAHGQGAFLYAFVFAVCKSSGFLFLKYAEQVSLLGASRAKPFSIPNASTKTCVVASAALAANAAGLIAVDPHLLFATLGIAAVTVRVFNAATGVDPYNLLQYPMCAVAFGRVDNDGEEEEKAKRD